MNEDFESQFALDLAALLGPDIMSLFASGSTRRILRFARSTEVRLDAVTGRGIHTGIRIDDTAVVEILDKVAKYAGILLNAERPFVGVPLPAELFRSAWFDGYIPPMSEAPWFVINTSAGLREVRERVLDARRERDGSTHRKARARAVSVRRQENGKQGEARTEWVLLKKLWVMRRSVDVEGADFVVQVPPSDDPLWGWQPDLDVFGHVQAKFFEGRNSVRVSREYVEHDGAPRLNFFLFLHTDDESGREARYFFTAAEITSRFNLKGGYYYFSLRRGRTFEDYRRSAGWIADTITRNLKEAHAVRKREIYDQLRRLIAEASRQSGDEYVYLLRRVEGANVVLCRKETGQETVPLDTRRDLFPYSGPFDWGRVGTGPLFLSVSLLAHHFGGREPTISEREKLLRGLICHLWGDEYNISTAMVDELLSRGPAADESQEVDGLES